MKAFTTRNKGNKKLNVWTPKAIENELLAHSEMNAMWPHNHEFVRKFMRHYRKLLKAAGVK